MRLVLTACGLALVLAACAPRREAPLPSGLDAYKRIVALDVLQHALGTYCQPGEEMLKSVVILEIAIDAEGRLLSAAVVRSNGYAELDQRALDTVQSAAPFSAPDAGLVNGSASVKFLETFLFREDDCFHIRSLAR
ncbi:MAG: periplasmic protein TonB [Betaproteobacteria bacterium]|jgi:protein TonB|nr:periplasmic protein TonB [Betaproteobacteria bacterium]